MSTSLSRDLKSYIISGEMAQIHGTAVVQGQFRMVEILYQPCELQYGMSYALLDCI
jgi:hypothetical protein